MRTNEQQTRRVGHRQVSCGVKGVTRKAKATQVWEINMRQVSRACDEFWDARGLTEPTRTLTFQTPNHYWSTPTEI